MHFDGFGKNCGMDPGSTQQSEVSLISDDLWRTTSGTVWRRNSFEPLCRNHCPFEAIRLDFSEEFYTLTPRIDLDRCPGCGACEVACPTQPVKAIVVRGRGSEE